MGRSLWEATAHSWGRTAAARGAPLLFGVWGGVVELRRAVATRDADRSIPIDLALRVAAAFIACVPCSSASPPPPPSFPPPTFPPHPGPWTRDWDDPAGSPVFSATLFGTAAAAGCAPAAPAGLCVRRRWSVGDHGSDGDNDDDGKDDDDDEDVGGGGSGGGVHGPAPWDEPGVVAMLAAGRGAYATYAGFAEELERSAGWVALGVGGVAADGGDRGDMVRWPNARGGGGGVGESDAAEHSLGTAIEEGRVDGGVLGVADAVPAAVGEPPYASTTAACGACSTRRRRPRKGPLRARPHLQVAGACVEGPPIGVALRIDMAWSLPTSHPPLPSSTPTYPTSTTPTAPLSPSTPSLLLPLFFPPNRHPPQPPPETHCTSSPARTLTWCGQRGRPPPPPPSPMAPPALMGGPLRLSPPQPRAAGTGAPTAAGPLPPPTRCRRLGWP